MIYTGGNVPSDSDSNSAAARKKKKELCSLSTIQLSRSVQKNETTYMRQQYTRGDYYAI